MEVGQSGEAVQSGAVLLPYAATSVGAARRRLIGDLTGAGVPEATACDAGLVLSELISNALRHATPLPGRVVRASWKLGDGYVEVAVSDGGGPTVPAVSQPASNAIGGRGLGIVDRLSLRWGVTARPDGGETTVWAALSLGDSAESAAPARAGHNARDHHGAGPSLVIASSRDA